jgi:hypothetical protein
MGQLGGEAQEREPAVAGLPLLVSFLANLAERKLWSVLDHAAVCVSSSRNTAMK